jgi:hypothetical protein
LSNESFRKMDDVELVLRFFAYRQRLSHQDGALMDYLDRYLELGNSFSPNVLEQLENLFVETTNLVYSILGTKAFWLWRYRESVAQWNWFGRATKVLYDPIMFVFSQYIHRSHELNEKRDIIQGRITQFYQTNYKSFEGRSTNISNNVIRNRLFTKLLDDVLGG